ncbi:hypothetical protein B0H11DRAFT_1757683 [Mycena galericulata]|nr:hypothetical protein B0H11DRAFT_1757683 [Mycena galericulata]
MEEPPQHILYCSQSKCNAVVPPAGPGEKQKKTCPDCRHSNRRVQAAKRKRVKEAEEVNKRVRMEEQPNLRVPDTSDSDPGPQYTNNTPMQQTPDTRANTGLESDGKDSSGAVRCKDTQSMLNGLKDAFKTNKRVEFHGTCQIPEDPLVSDKERVQMTIYEIWKVTGYRFRVKENYEQKTGHKTRLYCCQDSGRKHKSRPSQREGAVHRDTLGMERFDCKSCLRVACISGDVAQEKKLRIYLRHDDPHVAYYDVALPPGSAAIIREGLHWRTPNQLVPEVQAQFPSVTSNQVHFAWTKMSEILWKRDEKQLPSAQILLNELGDDVDVLDVHPAEGVEQLCWAMKKIITPLRGKIVEIALTVHRARAEFALIDPSFKPARRADPTEHEGGFLASAEITPPSMHSLHPNSVGTIKIPASQPRHLVDPTRSERPTIPETDHGDAMDVDDETTDSTRRTFCPSDFRQPIINFMENHLCAHPLIPGYAQPSPEGIREWAVREAYTFCVDNDLREVWAYLWENWYRRGRWELWARAEHPEIPRLKTTMMVESQWVTRNRTVPFWSHPLLKPLGALPVLSAPQEGNQSSTAPSEPRTDADDGLALEDEVGEDSDDDLLDADAGHGSSSGMFDERLNSLLNTLRDFSDGIEYQRQFRDSRMLDVLEREGASFLRLAENCLSRERRVNSTRSAALSTWERSTLNAMFYRTRPVLSDRDT